MATKKKAAKKATTGNGREQVVLRFRKGLKNAVIKAAGDQSLNSFIESKLAKSVGFSLA
jgi:hypothetical protein